MKKLLFVFILTVSQTAIAQDLQYFALRDGQISYERVEQLDTMKADYVFKKTKEWVIEKFKSSKDVVQGESKPSLIKCNYLTTYAAAMGTKQKYTNDLTFKIKDGAIKIIISNYITASGSSQMTLESYAIKDDGSLRPSAKKAYQSMEDEGNSLTESLLKYLRAKSDF